jgi:hypothetical protein
MGENLKISVELEPRQIAATPQRYPQGTLEQRSISGTLTNIAQKVEAAQPACHFRGGQCRGVAMELNCSKPPLMGQTHSGTRSPPGQRLCQTFDRVRCHLPGSTTIEILLG